jgi:hypothetical protein
MAYCSAGDLSVYIKQKGRVVGLSSSSSHQSSSSSRRDQKGKGRVQDDAGAGEEEELYPHPKEGGLNEVVVRCFLGQLGEFISGSFFLLRTPSLGIHYGVLLGCEFDADAATWGRQHKL